MSNKPWCVGAVIAAEAATVHAEDDRQLLQSNVVYHLIERALKEG